MKPMKFYEKQPPRKFKYFRTYNHNTLNHMLPQYVKKHTLKISQNTLPLTSKILCL